MTAGGDQGPIRTTPSARRACFRGRPNLVAMATIGAGPLPDQRAFLPCLPASVLHQNGRDGPKPLKMLRLRCNAFETLPFQRSHAPRAWGALNSGNERAS